MTVPEGTTLMGGAEGGRTTETPGGSQAGGSTGGGGSEGARAGGAQPESLGWRAAVKAEVRDHELLKEVKDVTDLSTRYIGLHQRQANAITKPGDKATKEELDAYYAALGRPQSKDGYKLDAAVLPEAMRSDADFNAWLRETLYDAGASQTQAALFTERLGKRLQTGIEQSRQHTEAARETLKKDTSEALAKEFGNDAQVRLIAASQARDAVSAHVFAGDRQKLQRELNESGDGNKLWVIKVFDWIAQHISPDTMRRGAAGPEQPKPSAHLTYPDLGKWLGLS